MELQNQPPVIVILLRNNPLVQLLSEAEALDWNRVKVASAIGPLLRFKLGDCFRLLIAHTERHLLQGQEVLEGIERVSTR